MKAPSAPLLAKVTGALLLTGALACLAMAAAMRGGRWSDRLDVATHFAPFVAAGCLVAVIASASGRRLPAGRWALAMAILSLLGSAQIMAPEVWAAATARQATPDGPTLKIVQFNLWGRNVAADETLRWIVAQDADVVVLQEAFGESWRINKALRRAYPHWSSCDLPRPCSVMVLSRLPMTARGSGRGPPTAWARYRWRDREVTVVGAHYFWPYPAGQQQWQSRNLAAFLEPHPRETLIVAGDFNSTPWSHTLARQDAAFGIERRTRMLWSYPARRFASPLSRITHRLSPAPFPVLPIDHVYAGDGWRTVKVGRGPRLGSDHYPVIVELAPR
jgi:endonuclease/exonuclease/phosphatase (EEP) superfamily protein YafD